MGWLSTLKHCWAILLFWSFSEYALTLNKVCCFIISFHLWWTEICIAMNRVRKYCGSRWRGVVPVYNNKQFVRSIQWQNTDFYSLNRGARSCRIKIDNTVGTKRAYKVFTNANRRTCIRSTTCKILTWGDTPSRHTRCNIDTPVIINRRLMMIIRKMVR